MSAYHLYGKSGYSGENSNGTVYPGGIFLEKRYYHPRYYLFLAFPGIPGNL